MVFFLHLRAEIEQKSIAETYVITPKYITPLNKLVAVVSKF